ncbi:glycoside hydrolase family protein [Evansella halocellulosilytica]|uniref:hypothetical protein n=1 Tax=Evansella halocellulosilytica TaxID=2011013 RepID=UPI000BB9B603|nr:hypothetical protein [Evansella halocellulosilytica]
MKNTLESIYKALLNEDLTLVEVGLNTWMEVETLENQQVVFLTISDDSTRAYTTFSKASSLIDAIKQAIISYLDSRPNNHKVLSVKLDILTGISSLMKSKNNTELFDNKLKIKEGFEGIAFGTNFDVAFSPGEVAANEIITNDKLVPENLLNAYKQNLSISSANFAQILTGSDPVEVYKFNTKSFYINDKEFLTLYRGHREFPTITKEDLWNAIELTKDHYFKNAVNGRGKFIYSYLPQSNTIEKKYNILRHAGTVYSMIETYELMPDESLLNHIHKAISFLLKKIKEVQVDHYNTKVVVDKGAFKLGGNGLTIVALAKYTQVMKDDKYVPVMQDMAKWILLTQEENGRFPIHKQMYSTGEVVDFTSRFYPGEAILSLVRLYQIDKNEEWLDVAEKAANYLINIRDKNETLDTITPDHWLLYALNDLHRERPKQVYIKHSLLMSNAIFNKQITDEKDNLDWNGGYGTNPPPKSTQAACYSEGLGAAYNLANDHGYKKEADEIKKVIDRGIRFQLQLQLRLESTMHYVNKNLCIGAIQKSPTHLDIRNDYTQHNISSFIAFYKILTSN